MSITTPVLLYDGECHVCRVIAHWVERAARRPGGAPVVICQAIGEDPAAIRALNPGLTIWEAYAAPHVLMPDGSMSQAGYAVRQVFALLPSMRWAARICDVSVAGMRPFQMLLNVAYVILADIRPLLGCESCGRPILWVRPLFWVVNHVKRLTGHAHKITVAPHFNSLRAATLVTKPGG